MTGTGGPGFTRIFPGGTFRPASQQVPGCRSYIKGNYMTAARISYGVLSQDNFNIGFSLGYGNTLDTMGYNLRDPEPQRMSLAGADLAILRNNFEHRFDSVGRGLAWK